ncbi:MAG: hypothetical protein JWP76_1536, partial [Dactylosporangium sp.]|nr:hypothetical protein [Dactylosporangium sp.]
MLGKSHETVSGCVSLMVGPYSPCMLDLELLRDDYAVCRLPVGSPLPQSLLAQAGQGA